MSNHNPTALANILVVDDRQDSLRFLVTILSKKGYVVQAVINGHLAIRAAQANPPDLILLDIMLSGMDGYEVYERLQANELTRDIPVIFISAKVDISEKVKTFAIGGADYISKPFYIEELVARIEHQLKIQRLQKQLTEQKAQLLQEMCLRQAAETEIIRSRNLLESIFNESADAIFLVNHETGLTLDCNQRAVEMFAAKTKEELLNIDGGSLQKELFNPGEFQSIGEELERQGIWSRELEYVTKQGKLFWGNLAIKQIIVAGKKMHIVRVTDISERKRTEAALRSSEERLQMAIAANNDGLFDINLLTQEFYLSPQWRTMIGYPLDKRVQNCEELLTLVHPDDVGLVKGILKEIFAGLRLQWQVEFRILRPDEEPIWILSRGEAIRDESGKVIRLSGTHTDISSRLALEQELALRENRLNAFFNCTPVGLNILDEQLRIVQINQPLAQINGLPVENHIGKTLHEVLPKLAHKLEPQCQQVLATGEPILNQEISGEVPSQPGVVRHWVVSYFPIPGEKNCPAGVGSVVVEITERKLAELELRLVTERLQYLLTSSPAAIYTCQPQENYGATFISENVSGIVGYSAQEFLDNTSFWASHIHPEDRECVLAGLGHLCEKEDYAQEYRFLHKDGSYRWVDSRLKLIKDAAGNLIECVGYLIDISSRKQIEQELRHSVQREKALASVIQKMRQTLDIERIFATTTSELRQVIKCDRVGVYIFYPDWSGEFIAEAVGSEWISLVPAQKTGLNPRGQTLENSRCPVKAMDTAPNLPQDTYLQETQGGYSSGASYRVVADIYSAGFTPCYINFLEQFQARAYIIVPIFCGSKLWGLLATYQNSGPRQWQAAEINMVVQIGNQLGVALQQAELLEQTLLQSQALQKALLAADAANSAKSEFLANMSHELRTPLNAILGFTQLMSRDLSLSSEHQQNLQIINRAGEHLLGLINNILEMSKIEAGRTTLDEKSFDLIRLLNLLEEMWRLRAFEKGLKLKFEYAPNLPRYARADAGKLRQILLNLLGNAIKFTKYGSVTLRVKKENSRLFFEVEDTGAGIAAEEMNLLFEAFGQTSTGIKSQQGTGLGLPISRKYVQLMGGDITVSSTLCKGSLFAFDIKIGEANATEIQTVKNKRKVIGLAPNQPEYRLLVVDDISESRILVVKLFTSIGFKLREAENGQEAIIAWENWQPHLILMDMRMPVMDGYSATQQIRAREQSLRGGGGGEAGEAGGGGENLPNHQSPITNHQSPITKTVIIAFTASASAFSEQKQGILAVGCDDCVNKPFSEEVLLEKISQHLGVQYVYEEASSNSVDSRQKTEEISTTDLLSMFAQMPESWVAHVQEAASQCSHRLILQLLEQISPEYAPHSKALKDLANNFQFDKIIELSENVKK